MTDVIATAALASTDVATLVERAGEALASSRTRATNAFGVVDGPAVHRDLTKAADALSAALIIVSSTYWPIARDYEGARPRPKLV